MKSIHPLRNLAFLLLGTAALAYGGLRLGAFPAEHPATKAIIGKQPDGTYFVPTGQTLTPAGRNLTFAGRPVDMALSPDGKTLAVMLGREVKLFDTLTGTFRPESLPGSHNYSGIAWAKDGTTLYTTGQARGAGRGQTEGAVQITRISPDGRTNELKPIPIPFKSRIQPAAGKSSEPCGISVSPDGNTLYVSLFNNHTLAVIDLKSYTPETGNAKIVEVPVGSSPERLLVSPDGTRVYVANRGGKAPQAGDTMDTDDPVVVDRDTYKVATGTLSVVSTAKIETDPEHAVAKTVTVGLEPVALAFSPDGKFLYVANANGETVSVLSTADDAIVETIPTSPAPGKLAASCPNGLAVSPDGKTLYVTLAGDNAVEELTLSKQSGGDAAQTHIAGLIPTAWFPLAVTLSKDNKTLFVANTKGIGSEGEKVTRPRANNGVMTPKEGPGGVVEKETGNFVGRSVYAVLGSLGVIEVPDAKTLLQDTATVSRNNRFDRMALALSQKPDPFWTRFKHVVLVIKENRTYDQVFGDIALPAGHIGGDPNLVMFGAKITPNQHALAKEFGLFDNLYCSGAISSDGHHWLNEAFASDYSERAMNNYPRSYPCCGTDPLVYAGNKFLWQAALDAGKTYRNYGEFAPLPSIQRHSNNTYNDKYDITPDQNEDVVHADRIIADLNKDPKANPNDPNAGLPQFTTIWFPNNHTSGTSPGAYTPESDVADNDLAVGKFVEAISHSKKYWQDEPTLILVVEDDAQGGLDHIEGHRTVGLVISPFNKRGQIVSTNFNQMNILKTIEAVLDIKPINQFDAAALPMRSLFQDKPDFRPYELQKNQVPLNLKNPPARRLTSTERHWAEVCATLDFSAPDKADPEKLTEALWHHTHGDESYPPADAAR